MPSINNSPGGREKGGENGQGAWVQEMGAWTHKNNRILGSIEILTRERLALKNNLGSQEKRRNFGREPGAGDPPYRGSSFYI